MSMSRIDDVRLLRDDLLQRRLAIVGFADDTQMRNGFEHLTEALPQEGVVVGDENADVSGHRDPPGRT